MKGIDTNVLIRLVVSDDKKQAEQANAYVEAEGECFINRIVLCETVWVLEKAYQYPRPQIVDFLEHLFRTAVFVIEDADTAWKALADYKSKKVDFADALIGYSNKQQGCEETATFDKKAATMEAFVLLGK